jgi:hypothetical protein
VLAERTDFTPPRRYLGAADMQFDVRCVDPTILSTWDTVGALAPASRGGRAGGGGSPARVA